VAAPQTLPAPHDMIAQVLAGWCDWHRGLHVGYVEGACGALNQALVGQAYNSGMGVAFDFALACPPNPWGRYVVMIVVDLGTGLYLVNLVSRPFG